MEVVSCFILSKIFFVENLTLIFCKKDIEIISLEFLLRNQKWLCIGLYKLYNQNENAWII